MARMARLVVAGEPHHVTQRGNRRQKVFFKPEDKETYLRILGVQARLFGMQVWAYCLMDNHVHLIVVPEREGSLTKVISETHELYTRMINFREGWRGYLWQGRFKSVVMDEKYLYAAVRYVERNPVRAGLVKTAAEYEWSSARAHICKQADSVLSLFYMQEEIENWTEYLSDVEKDEELIKMRRHSESGRPMGSFEYLRELEGMTGRELIKRRPGPKAKQE